MLNIKKNILTDDQYYKENKTKKVLVIHHTAGGPNPLNVIHGWQFNPERVGTAYVIAGKEDSTKSYKEGDIFQAFEDNYWCHHLGLKAVNNTFLNQQSIAIEICNWGQLIYKDGKYWNYVNKEVPESEVEHLEEPYRTFKYYHKYSDAQLQSLKELLIYLCDKYSISKEYHSNMFDVNSDALNGDPGIWTHSSYRADKFDCSPQTQLIAMLKSLAH